MIDVWSWFRAVLATIPTRPIRPVTQRLSNLEQPPPEMLCMLAALATNQDDTNHFFGAWAGTIPIPEFFAPDNIQRIMTAAENHQAVSS
jgi:hypothetical protein